MNNTKYAGTLNCHLLVMFIATLAYPAHAQSLREAGMQLAFDRDRNSRGPIVVDVTSHSMAARLGIKPGDRLLRLGALDLNRRALDVSATPVRVQVRRAVSASDLLPVLVSRQGSVYFAVASRREAFTPVPLTPVASLLRALDLAGALSGEGGVRHSRGQAGN